MHENLLHISYFGFLSIQSEPRKRRRIGARFSSISTRARPVQ